MDTLATTLPFDEALDLCERGRQGEAVGALSGLKGPERSLIEGAILAFSEPEKAKDLLSKAEAGLGGIYRQKAAIWLSCCYWATGEINEARALLDSVEPESDPVKFLWGFSKAAFEMSQPERALEYLSAVEGFADQVNPLWRGKFHNQRAAAMRRLGKSDNALIDYEAAKYWFQVAELPKFYAGASNNVAGVLSDLERFDEAHQVVDDAIETLQGLGDSSYLGQMYDQKAQIFLAQSKYTKAAEVAPKSISLLENGQEQELFARSLLTHAKALKNSEREFEAFRLLVRAVHIGERLSNHELLFDVLFELRDLSKKVALSSERKVILIALKGSKSIRTAAKKMGIKHPSFLKAMKKHGIAREPEIPTSPTLNARKKLKPRS